MGLRMASNRLVNHLQNRVSSGFFGDSGILLQDAGTGTFDDNNTETIVTTEVPVDCSFTDKPSMENWRDYADIEQVDAEVRFTGHSPAKGNRFKVTGRFDTNSYVNKTFEIVGIRNRDVFGYVCALKAVSV